MLNPATTDLKITGQATLGLRDIYAASFWGWPARVRWAYGIGWLLIGAYTFWLDRVRDEEIFYASGFLMPAGMFLLAVVAWLVLLAVFFARMSPEQKKLEYEIGREHIIVRDAAGATVGRPWSQVRACCEHKTGFSLRLRPMGSHWVVKRAFVPSELVSLRALTTSLLGSSR